MIENLTNILKMYPIKMEMIHLLVIINFKKINAFHISPHIKITNTNQTFNY